MSTTVVNFSPPVYNYFVVSYSLVILDSIEKFCLAVIVKHKGWLLFICWSSLSWIKYIFVLTMKVWFHQLSLKLIPWNSMVWKLNATRLQERVESYHVLDNPNNLWKILRNFLTWLASIHLVGIKVTSFGSLPNGHHKIHYGHQRLMRMFRSLGHFKKIPSGVFFNNSLSMMVYLNALYSIFRSVSSWDFLSIPQWDFDSHHSTSYQWWKLHRPWVSYTSSLQVLPPPRVLTLYSWRGPEYSLRLIYL